MDMLRRLINCHCLIKCHQNWITSSLHYKAYSRQVKSISDQ